MNKDELRQLRLRKFDNISSNNDDNSIESINSNDNSNNDNVIDNTILSPINSNDNDNNNLSRFDEIMLSSRQYKDIMDVLFTSGGSTLEDMVRWYEQGFEFYENQSFSFGLKQSKGGPCGILATVQAEIILEIQKNHNHHDNDLTSVSKEDVFKYLVIAITNILIRASSNDIIYLVSPSSSSSLLTVLSNEKDIIVYKCNTNNIDAIRSFMFISLLPSLSSKSGSMLFLLSLILTRGIENIRHEDMDMESTLIGQFGHCNQELINLLLTGRATSNVHDGNIPLGDSGMLIKGISKQSTIGYLTHLEALRLCQVGNYYKVPQSSVWVIGSSSHFTVLFCMDYTINQLSLSEKLLIEIQKAFKKVDTEDAGFISSNDIATVLKDLNTNINSDYDISRFKNFLSGDSDIILFSTFWEHVSKIMTGTSLNSLLSSSLVSQSNNNNNNNVVTRRRSDSEIARQLQAEFDGIEYIDPFINNNNNDNNNSYNNNYNNNYSYNYNRERSNSDLARELQLQWEREDNANGLNFNNNSSSINSNTISNSSSSSDNNKTNDNKETTEEKSYTLYHYNGLDKNRSPISSCTITVTTVNCIGLSIENNTNTNSGNHLCPIEEVIKTRYPRCKINWNGNTPPSID